VERFPDGDDDFRAFFQADYQILINTTDLEPQEVLEIPVQWHDSLQISRSVSEKGQQSLACLLVTASVSS